jgi:hypothetical protein
MHFGENQLSRSLIGLSPLTTGHPPAFQRWWVRPSTPSYRRFSLPMARSLRFGSRTRDSNALFRLAFATATPPGLTSPRTTDSQAHSSKGTPSPHHQKSSKALTDCRQPVSGTLSLPSRGTFHLSLTVLVHYRSPGSIQPYQMVLADSRQVLGAHRYSGKRTRRTDSFHLPDYHRLRSCFPTDSANHQNKPRPGVSPDDARTPQPRPRNP